MQTTDFIIIIIVVIVIVTYMELITLRYQTLEKFCNLLISKEETNCLLSTSK